MDFSIALCASTVGRGHNNLWTVNVHAKYYENIKNTQQH